MLNINNLSSLPLANVHSYETFSSVDGPGCRFVVFLQGCYLRCKMCCNPDTWSFNKGTPTYAKEIADKVEKYKNYYKQNGGVTVTGGEPLNSPFFVKDLFERVHKLNSIDNISLTTCLDTAGYASPDFMDIVLSHSDSVMFCIKHPDAKKYLKLTGKNQEVAMMFWKKLEHYKIPYVIRHLIIPKITDSDDDTLKLCDMINTKKYCKGIELLPYHRLGEYKWSYLGLNYNNDFRPPTEEEITKVVDKIKTNGINVIY